MEKAAQKRCGAEGEKTRKKTTEPSGTPADDTTTTATAAETATATAPAPACDDGRCLDKGDERPGHNKENHRWVETSAVVYHLIRCEATVASKDANRRPLSRTTQPTCVQRSEDGDADK